MISAVAPTLRRLGNSFRFAATTIPTTDLYFLNACRDWVGRGLRPGPIVREGANSFSSGDVAVVCRRDTAQVVGRLLQHCRRLVYVIDDDLWAAEEDYTLPEDYRRRLIELRDGQHKRLVERAETVVVSSPKLVTRYQSLTNVVALDPYWSDPFADDRHFDALIAGGPLEIGYFGSASHAADRAFALAVFERLLDQDERIRATIVGRADLPAKLRGHPRLRILDPLPWSRHRRRLRRLRFHLLLYPTLPTPFNTARSINKMIEHAVLGGVGVYSDCWEFADRIAVPKAGLLARNRVETWVDAVSELTKNFSRLKDAQQSAAEAAKAVNDLEFQRAFWSERLGA